MIEWIEDNEGKWWPIGGGKPGVKDPPPLPCFGLDRPWDVYQHMLGEAADALGMPGSPDWREVLQRMRDLQHHMDNG